RLRGPRFAGYVLRQSNRGTNWEKQDGVSMVTFIGRWCGDPGDGAGRHGAGGGPRPGGGLENRTQFAGSAISRADAEYADIPDAVRSAGARRFEAAAAARAGGVLDGGRQCLDVQ